MAMTGTLPPHPLALPDFPLLLVLVYNVRVLGYVQLNHMCKMCPYTELFHHHKNPSHFLLTTPPSPLLILPSLTSGNH